MMCRVCSRLYSQTQVPAPSFVYIPYRFALACNTMIHVTPAMLLSLQRYASHMASTTPCLLIP